MEYKLPVLENRLPSRSLISNLLVAGLSIGLLVWAFRLVYERANYVSSVDAVINGTIIDIKAPQEGVVSDMTVTTGDSTVPGKALLTLNNPRVSHLKVQEIQSKVNQQEADLENAQIKLEQLLNLRQTAAFDDTNQFHLENLEAQQSIEQAESDLHAAQARQNLAQLSYSRAVTLQTQGAISLSDRDLATAELQQRQAETNGLKRQLDMLRSKQKAARLGLTLSNTRSNSDPRLRLEDLQVQISDQQQKIRSLEQQVKDSKAELAQAQADTNLQSSLPVNASTAGIVWQLAIQPGKVVQQGELLGQVIDCRQRWVDAYVDEKALRHIQPGTVATIELYGDSSKTLTGRVSLIRSGIGRVAAGSDIVVPIASNLPRETQVRVTLDPDAAQGSSGQFCYVGYTGRVNFDIH